MESIVLNDVQTLLDYPSQVCPQFGVDMICLIDDASLMDRLLKRIDIVYPICAFSYSWISKLSYKLNHLELKNPLCSTTTSNSTRISISEEIIFWISEIDNLEMTLINVKKHVAATIE
ncbi:Uncharacterized protein Fot_56797 [Forsythia ovata]|uniref:Uncharacterized protein n=1 Tax=Forsythia ovata TaxID=205694 RepID=A0ABD1NY79_9LAMI